MRFWINAAFGAALVILAALTIWDVARIDLAHTLNTEQVFLPDDTPKKDVLDLVAQQRMADWAFWMMVLTAVGAVATFVSIVVAATAAGRQLEQARSTNEIQSRAYLHFNGTRHLSHRQDDGRIFWRVWVDWINVGATPALRANISVTLTKLGTGAASPVGPTSEYGLVVRSQGSLSTGPFDLWPEDIDESIQSINPFVLTGTATYSDVFSGTSRHLTVFRVVLNGYSGDIHAYYDANENPVFLAWSDDHSSSIAT